MASNARLIAGIMLAGVTAILVGVYTWRVNAAQQSEPFLRLVPTIAVAQSTTVPDSALETIYLPESAGALTSVAISDTPENRQWLKGRRAMRDIEPGALLLYETFNDQPANRFAARIQAGMRAISIQADATSAVSFLLEPGSRVDIVGTLAIEPEGPPTQAADGEALRRTSTQTILQNVRVLAVGAAISRGAYSDAQEGSFSTVTVEVTPVDAEKLIFARSSLEDGALTLLLRNPADTAVQSIPATTWKDLAAGAPR